MSPNLMAAIGQAAPEIRRTMEDIEERPRRALEFQNQQEQWGQQKAINQMRIEQMQTQMAEEKKKREWLQGPFDITLEPWVSTFDETFQNKLIKMGVQAKAWNEKGQGTRENGLRFLDQLKQSREAFVPLLEEEANARYSEVKKLQDQLVRETEKSGYESPKVQELRDKITKGRERLDRMRGFIKDYEKVSGHMDVVKAAQGELMKLRASGQWGTLPDDVKAALETQLRIGAQTGDLGKFTDLLGKVITGELKPKTEEKSQTEEQLTRTALFDPDPNKKKQAATILNAMQARKIEIAAAQAGANEIAKMNADKQEAMTIINQSNLVQRLLDGKTAPSDISQSFRQPWVRILAVGEAMKKDPTYNEIQADANKQWYSAPNTQRLIRRTESIVAPGGAADEAIRVAELVDNPAGTPINKITGKVKVAFGNSQRALLTLVQGISSEEIQQIMGAQGGGERFLQFTQQLNDPNLSVQQYTNNVKELKYLILTRQLANTRGTPEQKKWEDFATKAQKERPFGEEKPKVTGGAEYTVGKIYTNAQGQKAKYLGEGKWQLL